MNIIFNDAFYYSDYTSDGASIPGRMESIMDLLLKNREFTVLQGISATEEDLFLAHTKEMISKAKQNVPLFDMAQLAAGVTICAAELAIGGQPAFACVRPPGHHASQASTWDYCVFCNIGIALLKLKQQKLVKSAFILDFDAHTGDGTIDVLKEWQEATIFNPFADNNRDYIQQVQSRLQEIDYVDIVAVSAGFDSGINDLGHKLETFDFYQIGYFLKQMTRRMGHNRRFAVLEGGYFLPDLGKNVQAFCEGFR
jgi:acetoin utilization deacetylase AcuC-like enzyme